MLDSSCKRIKDALCVRTTPRLVLEESSCQRMSPADCLDGAILFCGRTQFRYVDEICAEMCDGPPGLMTKELGPVY